MVLHTLVYDDGQFYRLCNQKWQIGNINDPLAMSKGLEINSRKRIIDHWGKVQKETSAHAFQCYRRAFQDGDADEVNAAASKPQMFSRNEAAKETKLYFLLSIFCVPGISNLP